MMNPISRRWHDLAGGHRHSAASEYYPMENGEMYFKLGFLPQGVFVVVGSGNEERISCWLDGYEAALEQTK